MWYFESLLLFIGCKEVFGLLEGKQVEPPTARFGYFEPKDYEGPTDVKAGNPDSYWERSGYFEGDIMVAPSRARNGLLSEDMRWPNGTVPFYIKESYFTDEDVKVILEAFREFHRKTCIKLRPYKDGDSHWIYIMGNNSGCWSHIGMQGEGGQEVNCMPPKCMGKGTIMHELLHALGFYHQQSAHDRDEFVKIHWDNIMEGRERNFEKYPEDIISDYDTEYDYGSIMHYSPHAFSKDGESITIEPLQNITEELGQRRELSKLDILKVNRMYADLCYSDRSVHENAYNGDLDTLEWFETL